MSFRKPLAVAVLSAAVLSAAALGGCVSQGSPGVNAAEPAAGPVALNTLPGLSVVELKVPGLKAESERVELLLERVDGYKGLKADLERETARVVYDPARTNPELLLQTLNARMSRKASISRSPGELDPSGGQHIGDSAHVEQEKPAGARSDQ
ncbi:MAG: heavy-metal-associated domain-containing protein [Armatimonadota bacterium]